MSRSAVLRGARGVHPVMREKALHNDALAREKVLHNDALAREKALHNDALARFTISGVKQLRYASLNRR